MRTLFKARLEILLFLLLLLSLDHFGGIPMAVRLSISVGDTYINNAVGALGPKPTKEDVAMVIFSSW